MITTNLHQRLLLTPPMSSRKYKTKLSLHTNKHFGNVTKYKNSLLYKIESSKCGVQKRN
jgi:hypothetical protein